MKDCTTVKFDKKKQGNQVPSLVHPRHVDRNDACTFYETHLVTPTTFGSILMLSYLALHLTYLLRRDVVIITRCYLYGTDEEKHVQC